MFKELSQELEGIFFQWVNGKYNKDDLNLLLNEIIKNKYGLKEFVIDKNEPHIILDEKNYGVLCFNIYELNHKQYYAYIFFNTNNSICSEFYELNLSLIHIKSTIEQMDLNKEKLIKDFRFKMRKDVANQILKDSK